MKEVRAGPMAGPYEKIPYGYYVQSPLGLVPKANGQTRMIFHLSFDFDEEVNRSINFYTPYEICSVKYKDLDHAVRNCIQLITSRNGTVQIHFAKSNLKNAFRLAPVSPLQHFLLLSKAVNPLNGRTMYFVKKCLPFGASISCSLFQKFSDSLQFLVENIAGRKLVIRNYLDDYLFLYDSEHVCNGLVSLFLSVCEHIGCPVSLDKTQFASKSIQFLGVELNGASHTLRVPEDKRRKAVHLINWILAQKGKATVKLIQRLTGTLNFL